MNTEAAYPIGTPGKKWGQEEQQQWLLLQSKQRSYQNNVVDKLMLLSDQFDVEQYGQLDYEQCQFPLYCVKTKQPDPTKPTVLVTGGVHGYETSGVHGAIRFLETKALEYSEQYNIVVAPCVSPWAYETINRWNPNAVDPNRSFVANSPAQESAALMALVDSLGVDLEVHVDLHETTDTDNSEFRPALAARDNVYHAFWEIPDGFYLVGDTDNPCDDFQAHIIKQVSQVTHIAPSDDEGRIIGEKITQQGVINYATQKLGLCTGFSHARFNTTTEVYPDSPLVDDENCVLAQVMAVTAALDFVAGVNS